MAGYFLKTRLCDRSGRRWWAWLAVLLLASLAVGSTAAESAAESSDIDAEGWRSRKLEAIATRAQGSKSDDERLEYAARQSWLRRWKPGQMPLAPAVAPVESELVEEPLLRNLERPETLDANAWHAMIVLQTRLLAVDTDDERKENLRTTIELASQLETALSEQLPSDSQSLATPTDWILAYTRYRLGRALAYRELPEVREGWPISNPDQYQEKLVSAFQRLTEHTNGDRPEFILLQDRMFRRSGKKGRALELLEENRQSIEPKWYLKKRRDLLQELGWGPPYREAARLYLQAGYDDES